MAELDDITGAIVDASVRIHRELGPGLLEAVYEIVLARALERRGLQVVRQRVIRREGLHRVVNGLPSSASPRLRVNQSAS
jgi:hypothetical protein